MNAVLGDLPTWNLADLYSSPAGNDLESDLKRAATEADAFSRDYEGKVTGLDGKALLAAAGTDAVKAKYEQYTEDAIARSVFGSPTYVVDGDMFYGQDRLEMVERALRQPYRR